jgi:hypothetical protein
MNENQRAALLFSQSVVLLARVSGMNAANCTAHAKGEPLPFSISDFETQISESGVHWNGAISTLNGY